MTTGLIVILALLALGIAVTVAFRRRRDSDTDGRYLIERAGIAGLHCHPSIPRAVAEQMADLLLAVYTEAWPIVRDTYAAACHERRVPVPEHLPRWHTTRLEPGRFPDGRWTAYGVSSGVWALAVGCAPRLVGEELHSVIRSYLRVYGTHELMAQATTVHDWIKERWGGDIS